MPLRWPPTSTTVPSSRAPAGPSPSPSATPPKASYRGRFAPSPTGALHLGSLLTATASYLDARQHQGEWWLRVEDVDSPRVVPGAEADILRTLEAFGLTWDGPVLRQSERLPYYLQALEQLQAQGLLYACHCSRKTIAQHGLMGVEGYVYPGLCRPQQALPARALQPGRAWRYALPEAARPVRWLDRRLGWQAQNVQQEVGDFPLRRADGVVSYHLAVVVDDAASGITDVVRGMDLLHSTARQCLLQTDLALPRPRYLHLPILTNARGEKWSKQTLAPQLNRTQALPLLQQVAELLGLPAAPEGGWAHLDDFWRWATLHFAVSQLPSAPALVVDLPPNL